jgi:molybdenum cofactor cytidylyltransferase
MCNGCDAVIAVVVLAAGSSARLGEPKQLVMIAGETMLERAVRTALQAGFVRVIVVLGAESERIRERCNLRRAVVLVNEAWEEGMASSIRIGVNAALGADGVILMTCDQPAVTAEHLCELTAMGETTASSYMGRRGVPAYFPSAALAELMQLEGDAGARELLRGALAIELLAGELDVDTAQDLARARELFS